MTQQVFTSRQEILGRIRSALGRSGPGSDATVPPSARVQARVAGDPEDEIRHLLSEIQSLGGQVRRLHGAADLSAALGELVSAEQIERAVMWQTPELQSLGLAETLAGLGVEVVGPDASPRQIAACDVGITGVDAALPETGTLLLRSGPDRPRTASLLPPVHLAIMTPEALRSSLHALLHECRDAACATFITGPSRTSDIELTLTIGVHGPKVLHVWLLDAA